MVLNRYDKNGEPMGLTEWLRLFEDMEYRRVAWDVLPGDGHLSTVWLGLDHRYGHGPPLIFETMAFPNERYGDIQERYSTLEEALAGHARIMAELRARYS